MSEHHFLQSKDLPDMSHHFDTPTSSDGSDRQSRCRRRSVSLEMRFIRKTSLLRFSSQISKIVEKVTRLAGSSTDPAEYAKEFIARICPTNLPYALDSEAAFAVASFNGRGLADDVMDVMLALTTNTALGDGVAPDRRRIRAGFPYFGEPYA